MTRLVGKPALFAFILVVAVALAAGRAVPASSVAASATPPVPAACAGMRFAEIVVGTDGPDTLGPFTRSTLLFGLGGDDTLFGGAAADCISGGDGVDIIHGNNGRDLLLGDGGSDRIFGSNGPDYIDGGPDSDLCVGGGGPDVMLNCEAFSSLDPCDSDGVAVRWDVDQTGLVRSARILDIEAACARKGVSLEVRDGLGALIASSGSLAADGTPPISIEPTPLFAARPAAPCDPTSCTVQLAPLSSNGTYAGGHGIDGRLIERVDIAIVALP